MEKMNSGLSIWMNPITAWMYQSIEGTCATGCGMNAKALGGIMVRFDSSLKPFGIEESKWVFPNERFITYDKSDESWCRYFGIGRRQPARIVDGEIVLRQDIPLDQSGGHRDHVNCTTAVISDIDYFDACGVIDRIKGRVQEFLIKELLYGTRIQDR
jgi:hypothetical protein